MTDIPVASLSHGPRIQALLAAPTLVFERRDFARLDLASAAPEDVAVADGYSLGGEMPVDRTLVREKQILIRAVRDAHDVDVIEFLAPLSPIGVSHDVEPPDFPPGVEFLSRGNGPVKQGVEFGHALAPRQWLDVFEKRREPSNDAAAVQILCNPAKFIERNAGLLGAGGPEVLRNLLRPDSPSAK